MSRIGLLVLLGALTACATPERYISDEQDVKMRKECEPTGGCAIVPMDLWIKIDTLLREIGLELQDKEI
jgi:hypothetical protein